MTTLAQVAINGLALASIYALVALGFSIVYQATHTINLAQGSVLLLGGLVVARAHHDVGFWAALAIGVAVAAAVSVVFGLVLTLAPHRDVATLAIMMIGFDVLLLAELARRIEVDVLSLGDPWQAHVIRIGDVTVAQTRLAALVVAGILIAAFLAAFKYTRWGLSTRVLSMDREAAALMGIRHRRVELSIWALAGGLAAVAAVFVAAFPSQGLSQESGLIALAAFPAAVIGGLGSPSGALLGSVIIGLSQSAAATYQSELAFLGSGLPSLAPYVLMIVVLLISPHGLLGSKEVERV